MDQKDLLEKGMATHSTILAEKSYAQRDLAGYSLWGHKRVGHDSVIKHHRHHHPDNQYNLPISRSLT